MADECIHGFEAGLCDICYPRVQPVAAKPVRATTSRSARPPSRAAGAPTVAPFSLATQRVFHVTHIRNLDAILHSGELRADATPIVDVSSSTTRELRAAADLSDGSTVAGHVAFYASPTAARWIELRDGAPGPHWSDAARSTRATEFVLLAVPAPALGSDIVAADADAAAPATQFAYGSSEATQLLRRVRVLDAELSTPEILVPHAVPFDIVALIGVANDPMRDQVREMLAGVEGYRPKVAVYPPWFSAE